MLPPSRAAAAATRKRARRRRRPAAEASAAVTVAAAIWTPLPAASAAVWCENTATCADLLRPGSRCVDGYCTNPFSGGCLRNVLGPDRHPELRTCNSDDDIDAAARGLCSVSSFAYDEIRIAPGNWESSIFTAWIVQILLSELLSVPVTIETEHGRDGDDADAHSCSFYDDLNRFDYPKSTYAWDALRIASDVAPDGDCGRTSESCAHVIPEIWNGEASIWTEAQAAGWIEPVMSTDMVGQFGWFVPRFTIERDPSLASLAGLRGEANQKKLAARFKRPTTWVEYCDRISLTRCSGEGVDAAATAARSPVGEAEENSYFVQDLYTGHFRATEKNDCSIVPDSVFDSMTCTGHFVEPPCVWSAHTQSQLYWNDIKMDSDGPLPPQGSYSWGSMIQIWHAANATKSDVMMSWWRPDSLHEVFRGSDAEFSRVSLSEPTEECAQSRVQNAERCSDSVATRVGEKTGSCEGEAHVLKKALSSSLERSDRKTEDAGRSAGYDAIKRLRVSDLVIDRMLDDWLHRGVDQYGYDPRDVVCSWAAEHVDELRKFVPTGYPREIRKESQYGTVYHYAAMALGGLATFLILAAAASVVHWRNRRVMVYAQPFFILITLCGFLLTSGGAIAFATEPSAVSCVVREWLVLSGFSLELLPVVVKVAAINKLLASGTRMKRAKLKKRNLYTTVGFIMLLVSTFLAVWTALDPPSRQETLVLAPDENPLGGSYVEVEVQCSSDSAGWIIAAMTWQGVLLLSATVLAIQTRNVRQEFNETQRLAAMIFAHFFFISMRLVVFLLSPVVRANVSSAVMSYLLSGDTIFALGIYLLPKLLDARKPQAAYGQQRRRMSMNCAYDDTNHGRERTNHERGVPPAPPPRNKRASFFKRKTPASDTYTSGDGDGVSKAALDAMRKFADGLDDSSDEEEEAVGEGKVSEALGA